MSANQGLLESSDGRRLLAAQLFDSLGAGVGLVALPVDRARRRRRRLDGRPGGRLRPRPVRPLRPLRRRDRRPSQPPARDHRGALDADDLRPRGAALGDLGLDTGMAGAGRRVRRRHRAHVRRRCRLRRDRADRRAGAVRARPGPALHRLGDRDGQRPGARRPADRGGRPEPRHRGAVRGVRAGRRLRDRDPPPAAASHAQLRRPARGHARGHRRDSQYPRRAAHHRRDDLLEPRVLRLGGAHRALPARRHRARRPACRLGAGAGLADRHRHRARDPLARGPDQRRRR